MTTHFKALFTVTVAHTYYEASCEDVAFIVPADTARMLRNGGLLAKEIGGGFYVWFETDAAGEPLKPLAGRMLRIGLKLLNPFFSNFTRVDGDFASLTQVYGNTATPDTLGAPSKVKLTSYLFTHALTASDRPVTVRLKDNTGLVLQTVTLTSDDNGTSISYDLSGLAAGAYSVEEVFPNGRTSNAYYLDAELVQAGVFGVIEVRIAESFYNLAPEFQIDFEAREEALNYYIVARNFADADFNQLVVADAGSGAGGQPISFNKIPASSFTSAEIQPALLTGTNGKVVLFRSDATVARAEKARKKIQLKKNGDVLIAHLPQPCAETTKADLIIPLSKP